MSTVTALKPLEVTTSEAHVRIAHDNYSRKHPALVGGLEETAFEVWFWLFIPALGETLTYRAEKWGGDVA